jgi:hypothetical protein
MSIDGEADQTDTTRTEPTNWLLGTFEPESGQAALAMARSRASSRLAANHSHLPGLSLEAVSTSEAITGFVIQHGVTPFERFDYNPTGLRKRDRGKAVTQTDATRPKLTAGGLTT